MELLRWLPTRYHKLIGQMVRFGFSTAFSAAFSIIVPIGLHEGLGVNIKMAVAIGFVTAYFGNLVLMRSFVFKSGNSWKQDASAYVVTNAIFRLAEYLAFLALLAWTALTYVPALLVILCVSAIIKFFAYRKLFANR